MAKKNETEQAAKAEEKAGYSALGVFAGGQLVRTYKAKDYGEGSVNPTKKCDEDAESFAGKLRAKGKNVEVRKIE